MTRPFLSALRRRKKEILCFLCLPALMALYVVLSGRSFVALGPDAKLYLSIADNFLSTGHFAQTTREPGSFVVPAGLPLILTALRALRLPPGGIIALQYLLFGASCFLLSHTEEALFGGWWISPLLFTAALVRAHLEITNIYLEYYFLFCMTAVLFLLSRRDLPLKKKLLWLNAAALAGYLIRTVLILVYLPVLAFTLVSAFRDRSVRGAALAALVAPCLLFAAVGAVNNREVGHWIFSSNYSGRDVYTANNPETKTDFYSLSDLPDFVGEEYFSIVDDPTMDPTEKDTALTAAAGKWIRENPRTFIKNTVFKTWSLFVVFWRYTLLLALLAGLWGLFRHRPAGRVWTVCWAVNLLLALTTGMGLVMDRYSIVVWPLASLHLAGGWRMLLDRLKKN